VQFGYCSNTWGTLAGSAAGVTSVKDLFYEIDGSLDRAVDDIAEAGFTGLELFDGNLVRLAGSRDSFVDRIAQAGLELVSVYTGASFVYQDALDDEMHKVRRAITLAAQFGASRLVVGGGAPRAAGTRPDDYERLGRALDRVTSIAEDAGLSASFHPHLGTIVESPDELERLMVHTRIGFCPDVAHLAAGGGNPVAIIRRFADRITHVHVKDLQTEPFEFRPLGEGELDMAAIVNAVRESGYDSWLMVELDSYDGDPKVAAQISKQYLDEIVADRK
jgi:inosose dehydratase